MASDRSHSVWEAGRADPGLMMSFLLLALLQLPSGASGAGNEQEAPHAYVDPFIGTSYSGNTFPGAVRPWGMVSVSPHTNPGSPSGYSHEAGWFLGLGHVHLSGTGCPELGSIILTLCRDSLRTNPDSYRCTMRDQTASPGFYAMTLVEPQARIEVTATPRCGVSRFIILQGGDFFLLLNAGRNLTLRNGGSVEFISHREFRGFNNGGGFCGEANRHRVYFAARVDRLPSSRGVWLADQTSTQSWAANSL